MSSTECAADQALEFWVSALVEQKETKETPWPTGTRYIDADGASVVFLDLFGKVLKRQKTGNWVASVQIAESLNEEYNQWKTNQ